jgi:predicted nuclease of restriction endonuclease-like RecB superfamily
VLTADLVRARRRGEELVLIALDADARARAHAVAEAILGQAAEHVGQTRDELDEALSTIDVEPRDERLKAGLAKLVDDRCAFEIAGAPGPDESLDAAELRRALFLRACATRHALPPDARFDRDAVVASFAAERGLEAAAVERGLYADLRGAHVLQSVAPIQPAALVDAWERGQAQAVLLRAVRVTVDVRCASAGATRALFHRLKFLRLLHTITRTPTKTGDGHRVVIDGPFSLFESGTKYGLQLALVLPMLEGCDEWSLVADVRWGVERTPLVFRLEGGASGAKAAPPPLADDVAALVASFKRLGTAWRVARATAILDLPGVGLCVPDLTFERASTKVHLEVMGYWSRDAVWRRVELVQQGLAAPILFAVSSRLRVSEAVLGDDGPSALYVYKGTMRASAVAERIDALAAHGERVSSGA